MSMTNFKWAGVLSMAFLLAITGCSKKELSASGGNTPPGTGTTSQLLADSMYLYAQQVYYWNTQLPNYQTFNPRQYVNTNDSLGLANEQLAYTRIPKDANGNIYEQRIKFDQYGNPQPDNSMPKFSYIEYTSDATGGGNNGYVPFSTNSGNSNSMMFTLDGKDNGYGFVIGIVPASYAKNNYLPAVNKDSLYTIVRYVMTGSPSDLAGVKRGSIIAKINGQELDYTNNGNAADAIFDNALRQPTMTLTLFDPITKNTSDVSLKSSKGYTFNPIFKSTVFNYAGHNIAYLAFLSFTDLTTNAQAVLDSAFNSYAAKGITDIIVDLRYNGGGYINTADYLVDLISPSTNNGKVMHTDYYNQMMVNKQATLLKNIPLDYDNPSSGNSFSIDYSPAAQTTKIQKAGTIENLSKIYFIVSSGTASASELVINSLKPYFTNVTLIGAQFSDYAKNTYGKPVGFFEIRIGKFSMWTPNFETRNGANPAQAVSYQGFPTDYQASDNIIYDLGDPREDALGKAINLISGVTTTSGFSPAINGNMINRVRSRGNVIPVTNMISKPKRVLN